MSVPNLKSAAAAAMGAALMLSPMALASKVNAQEAIQVSNQSNLTTLYETSLSAGGHAAEFSDHKNSIGVIVFYGADVDPLQIGDAFASELRKRGLNAQSFAAPIDGQGASVAYQVGPSGIGPLGVQTAAKNMSKAIELSQARDRIMSSDYVMPAAAAR